MQAFLCRCRIADTGYIETYGIIPAGINKKLRGICVELVHRARMIVCLLSGISFHQLRVCVLNLSPNVSPYLSLSKLYIVVEEVRWPTRRQTRSNHDLMVRPVPKGDGHLTCSYARLTNIHRRSSQRRTLTAVRTCLVILLIE